MSLKSVRAGQLRALLRLRDLRLLLAAGLVSQTGDWVLGTAIAFQVYALTGSTTASAVALLATQAPQLLLGSIAGVLVDRWDRRRVMIVVNVLLGLVLLPLTLVRDASHIWIVFVVVAASSCMTPFFVAAEAALLPALVEPAQRVTANAVNAQVRNGSRLVGAAVGGLVVARGGLVWVAIVDIASFVLAAALIGLVRHRSTRTVEPLRLVRDWVEGIAVIKGSRTLVVVVFFFAVSGVGEAVMGTLFAPFVADVLGGSARALGTILGAQAVGGIVGGLLVTLLGQRFSPRALFGWGAVAFGIGDLALFLYPLLTMQVWPAVVLIALVGLPGAALFAGMLTLFQTRTEDAVRGRVFGALTTVQNAAMLACTYAAGSLANHFGIVAVISAQGAAYVVAGIVVLLALRSTPDPDGPTSDAYAIDAGIGALLDNPANSTRLPSMSLASNVRTRTVTDPLALRALAHPLRVELYSLVAREGSLTAADAARQLEISHALASHHLRQLAKYGFVEPAETPDHRAHPWRVTATSMELRPAVPEARASVDVLDRYTAEQATHQLAEWQERRADTDPAWTDPAGVRNGLLYLSPDELSELVGTWNKIIRQLADRRPIGHPEQRPADAEPVSVTLIAVPISPTGQGG